MSRAQAPPTAEKLRTLISPTVDMIGVKDSTNPFDKTYSGLEADSVVPKGETVMVKPPELTMS
jgi:hypothetical protein